MDITVQKMNKKSTNSAPPWFCIARSTPGDSITDYSRSIMDLGPNGLKSLKDAEQIFRYNNKIPLNSKTAFKSWGVVNLSPFPLSEYAMLVWQREQSGINMAFQAYPDLEDFLTSTTNGEQQSMLAFNAAAEKKGWEFTKKKGAEWGISIVDGGVITAEHQLGHIQKLSNELIADAVKIHGKKIFDKQHIKTLEAFIKSNPKYQELRQAINKLPSFLSKGLDHRMPQVGKFSEARWFRSQIYLPSHNPSGYCNSFGRMLGKKVIRLGGAGTASSWALPTAFWAYDVYEATPQARPREIAKGVRIPLGVAGTALGYAGGVVLVGILGISTGGVAFVVIALCAGAGGIVLSELGDVSVDKIFDSIGR